MRRRHVFLVSAIGVAAALLTLRALARSRPRRLAATAQTGAAHAVSPVSHAEPAPAAALAGDSGRLAAAVHPLLANNVPRLAREDLLPATSDERAPRGRRPRRANPRKILATVLVLGIVGAFAGVGSYSAFTGTTTNTGNSFVAGTVVLSDNDLDGFMLALTNAKPGDADSSCIKVTYTGTLSSSVRLFSTLTGTLGAYLTLTVTRGTDSSPSFDACTSFTADATNYIGQGAGVIYSGNLSAFPTTYGAAIVDPIPGTPESWTTSETHSYRFTVTLQDVNAAQGLSGTAGFTWEARNE